MLSRFFLILTGIYFLAGNILLPQGDFAALAQLPQMYQHCKTTEDPDMDILDFVAEHLLNLDNIFNKEEDTDEHELPHNPIPFHTTAASTFYYMQEPEIISFETLPLLVFNQTVYHNPYFPRLSTHKIFQPPRV
jgi:hypothetical protein